MEEINIDPRVIRTKKLIVDSFLNLSKQKAFSEISVKDITTEAMINRATFYNHFLDKYDLLEKVVSEKLSLKLNCSKQKNTMDLKAALSQIFVSLTIFMEQLNNMCKSGEEKDMIQLLLEVELNSLFSVLLLDNDTARTVEDSKNSARLLTHGFIGLNKDYFDSEKEESPEEFISRFLPFILNGIEANK